MPTLFPTKKNSYHKYFLLKTFLTKNFSCQNYFLQKKILTMCHIKTDRRKTAHKSEFFHLNLVIKFQYFSPYKIYQWITSTGLDLHTKTLNMSFYLFWYKYRICRAKKIFTHDLHYFCISLNSMRCNHYMLVISGKLFLNKKL